jgi:hypothetical protein
MHGEGLMKRKGRREKRRQTRDKRGDAEYGIFVKETYVNLGKGHIIGDSGVYETNLDSASEVFTRSRKEHGRCTGKVYIDTDKGPRQIGWVFEKRGRYEDTGEPFLMETWVDLHESEPETILRNHYLYLSG